MIFNEERRDYYLAKKRRLARENEAGKIIKEDALFIKHYGMMAFLELFPEAKGFGVNWHRSVVEELEHMEQVKLGRLLSGIHSAVAATKDRKANRNFRRTVQKLTK